MMTYKTHYNYPFATWKLEHRFIDMSGIKIALHMPNNHNDSQQTILFIHGLDGSFDGMKPLAYELRHDYNLVFIDLPGHGDSSLPTDRSIEKLDTWAAELIPGLSARGIKIDQIIAHSFGCRIAAKSFDAEPYPTIFLMPVTEASKTYDHWSRVVYGLGFLLAAIHNVPWYSAARGFSLCREKSRKTWHLMCWLASCSHPLYDVIRYRLAIAAHMDTYSLPKSSQVAVIVASHDSLPKTDFFDLSAQNPESKIQLFPGGHLALIESPAELAHELRRTYLL